MTKAQIKAEIDSRFDREMTTNYGWKCSPRKTRRRIKEQVERELASGNLVLPRCRRKSGHTAESPPDAL